MQIRTGLSALSAALSERNYRVFTIGNLVSHNGTWAQRAAVLWFTWEITGSGFWLGLMAVADLLPVVILGPIAGAIADRVDILKMLKLTQIAAALQSVLLAALTFAGLMTPELLFVLVLAHGIIVAINQAPRLALVPHLIERENMSAAIGINSMVFNSARATGPMIGGLLIDSHGVALAFAFNAVSYLWFVGALQCLRIANPRGTKPRTRVREIPREIAEGFRYALGHPGIGRLLIVLTVISICGRPYMELLSGFADEVFGRGVKGYSLMLSVTGAGAMLGGFALALRVGLAGLTTRVILGILFVALSLIGFGLTGSFALALVCLFVSGAAVIWVGVGVQTLMQTTVDPAMRGRVMSFYGMIGRGAPAIGALGMGAAAERFGFQAPIVAGAVICLGLWLWAARRRKEMEEAMEKSG
ncbi:MAG: MFS transporter [Rhodospirillaceae bacterium]